MQTHTVFPLSPPLTSTTTPKTPNLTSGKGKDIQVSTTRPVPAQTWGRECFHCHSLSYVASQYPIHALIITNYPHDDPTQDTTKKDFDDFKASSKPSNTKNFGVDSSYL